MSAAAQPNIPLGRRVIYSLVVVAVFFGGPELVLRALWSPARRHEVGTRQFANWLSDLSLGKDRNAELYEDDSELLLRLKPAVVIDSFNFHRAKDGESQPIRISINAAGYRGPAVPLKRAGNELRVLCMGDSNFFGYPLDDAQAFPRALEVAAQNAAHGRPVRVINGGVPGYTVVQGWRWYRRAFDAHDYDWLLLSYLNNDAWLQPHADRELLQFRASWRGRFAQLGDHLYLVLFGRSLYERVVPAAQPRIPRVSLDEFIVHYREFIAAARQHGAQVIILDYRAYESYEPYSKALQTLAAREHIGYLPISPLALGEATRGRPHAKYATLADRVARRWGADTLAQRSYLWYYAEYNPEHLNEVGTAWLADFISPALLR